MGEAGGVQLRALAERAVEIADAGLAARARAGVPDERAFLDPLRRSVETGRTQADDLLARYEGEWGGSLAPVYDACRL